MTDRLQAVIDGAKKVTANTGREFYALSVESMQELKEIVEAMKTKPVTGNAKPIGRRLGKVQSQAVMLPSEEVTESNLASLLEKTVKFRAKDLHDFQAQVERLWAAYPRKAGVPKKAAVLAMGSLTLPQFKILMQNFPAWCEHWQKEIADGREQWIKHLHRWINDGGYMVGPPQHRTQPVRPVRAPYVDQKAKESEDIRSSLKRL